MATKPGIGVGGLFAMLGSLASAQATAPTPSTSTFSTFTTASPSMENSIGTTVEVYIYNLAESSGDSLYIKAWESPAYGGGITEYGDYLEVGEYLQVSFSDAGLLDGRFFVSTNASSAYQEGPFFVLGAEAVDESTMETQFSFVDENGGDTDCRAASSWDGSLMDDGQVQGTAVMTVECS